MASTRCAIISLINQTLVIEGFQRISLSRAKTNIRIIRQQILVHTFLAKLLPFIPLPDVQKCNNTVRIYYNKKFILFLTQENFLSNCVGEKNITTPIGD
jgi:hypothetical protein